MGSNNQFDLIFNLDIKSDSPLFTIRVQQYIENDQLEEAAEVCQAGIAHYPDIALAHYLLGVTKLKQGKPAEGIEYLKKCIELDPGYLQAYHQLVELGEEHLDQEEIIQYYEHISQLNPFDSQAQEMAQHYEPQKKSTAAEVSAKPEPLEKGKPAQSEEDLAVSDTKVEEAEAAVDTSETEAEAELDEEEAYPSLDLESEEEPAAEINTPADDDQPTEPEAVTKPGEKEDQPKTEKEESAKPQRDTETQSEDTDSQPRPSQLDDMFNKLRSKPLDEVQQENWDFIMGPKDGADTAKAQKETEKPDQTGKENKEAKSPEEKNSPKPEEPKASKATKDMNRSQLDAMFAKIRRDSTTQLKEKAERKETAAQKDQADTGSAVEKKSPLKIKVDESTALEEDSSAETKGKADLLDREIAQKEQAIKAGEEKQATEKVELKIPIPTMTFVEVLKKQKLYDQALEILDALAKKSKDSERISKKRSEILQLKAQSVMD